MPILAEHGKVVGRPAVTAPLGADRRQGRALAGNTGVTAVKENRRSGTGGFLELFVSLDLDGDSCGEKQQCESEKFHPIRGDENDGGDDNENLGKQGVLNSEYLHFPS
ncbi:hypothetical protein [Austwickia chelonae]|uniref:hypothetical protein n=1 Tax=Austwickia chelonae TaxID=100225 RepID=UPI0011608FEF|nr:hypothetical protein [Austwickia chelonae]